MGAKEGVLEQPAEPRSITGLILDLFMNTTTEWFGLKETEGDPLKTSKGLRAVFIDMRRFNVEPFVRRRLLPEMFLAFFSVLTGVQKARRDYRKALSAKSERPAYASPVFWAEAKRKASSLGIGVIGFTPVDEELIFQNDHVGQIGVLYENAIVLGMEMDRSAIDTAPGPEAGVEAMRVYGALGKATNALADFVRSRGFKAIACHPLGGPVLYTAMAERAGMGEMGRLGLLVTREFGPRLRLSMIATNATPLPETPPQDFGVREFCDRCGQCVHSCPAGAIHEVPVPRDRAGLAQCVDAEKCFTQFYKTDGCSFCIKVCPFHKKGYEQVMRTRKVVAGKGRARTGRKGGSRGKG